MVDPVGRGGSNTLVTHSGHDPHQEPDALAIWRAGVDAARPERLLGNLLRVDQGPSAELTLQIGSTSFSLPTKGTWLVVGAGKAAAGMARGLVDVLEPRRPDSVRLDGLLSVPEPSAGQVGPLALRAGRPAQLNLPHADGVAVTAQILRSVAALKRSDRLIALVSGGASALLVAPAPGVSLHDLQDLTNALSDAGADITEMNSVRRPLSRVKGGGLLRATGAGGVLGLLLSDVIGDDLATIGSGPTVPLQPDSAAAIEVLERLGLWRDCPAGVRAALTTAPQLRPDRPPPVTNLVIGSNADAVAGAAREASARGFSVLDLGTRTERDPSRVATLLADLALSIRTRGEPVAAPVCIVAGGEAPVGLRADHGRGGRAQHLAVQILARLAPHGLEGITASIGGTDGEDGPTDAAGGVVQAQVVAAARALDLSASDALDAQDTYPFLDATGGLLRTGLTGTNVADLWVVTVDAPTASGEAANGTALR